MAATGANMVEYWHWHSLHYGQETYWKGVLSHDLEPGRTYAEVSRTAHELQRIGARIVGFASRLIRPRCFIATIRAAAPSTCRFCFRTTSGDMPWAIRADTKWKCAACTARFTA